MEVKIPFRVFFIPSAYLENMWKVFKRIWRIRRIYGCLQYTKSSPNTRKKFMRKWRGRQEI
jgi:hypothetical protein